MLATGGKAIPRGSATVVDSDAIRFDPIRSPSEHHNITARDVNNHVTLTATPASEAALQAPAPRGFILTYRKFVTFRVALSCDLPVGHHRFFKR